MTPPMMPSTAEKATPALQVASSDQLHRALQSGGLGEFEARSAFAACLMPLLEALGWRGDPRVIAEALPHFANSLNLAEFENVLAHLEFKTAPMIGRFKDLDERLLPALHVGADGLPSVVLSKNENGFLLFDGATRVEKRQIDLEAKGTFYLIAAEDKTDREHARRKDNWAGELFYRFRPTFLKLFSISFILNTLSLAVPLFIMMLYDRVIPSRSVDVLGYLMLGLTLAFGIDFILRKLRARMIAHMGGRVENIVANATFGQILTLPPSLTESAPIGAQVSRLREFDSVRDLFTGTLVNVVLELPFVLLFMAVIGLIAGPLVFVPIAMIACFAVIAALFLPKLKRAVSESSGARAKRHSFLVETVTNMRTIREAGAEDIWGERYRALSAETAMTHFKTSQANFLLQTLSQTVMLLAGVATVAWGVILVLDDAITVGALIATMALVWRVLSPIQNLFLTLTRVEQVKGSLKQINQLMRLPVEAERAEAGASQRIYRGQVSFSRVSFRHTPSAEPALLGAAFSAEPGQLIAFMGSNGAGKSTVLHLAAGMYRPQAGQVSLDGLDIRQINPIELRQLIAYVPQYGSLFHGTFAQNLRLSNPVATEDGLREACEMAGILGEIEGMPRGFETRIGDQAVKQLNSGFRQKLSLARAYVRKAPVILMDEPAQNLDEEGDTALMNALKALKGETTILMVSHRPSHIRLADEVIIMDAGVMTMKGAPDDILERLPGGIL